MTKLAQGFSTAAQDSNPGSHSRESEALPLSHCALQFYYVQTFQIRVCEVRFVSGTKNLIDMSTTVKKMHKIKCERLARLCAIYMTKRRKWCLLNDTPRSIYLFYAHLLRGPLKHLHKLTYLAFWYFHLAHVLLPP